MWVSPLNIRFILGWKIQYAVIYKGYKFFNKESEPGKNLHPLRKCPAFKAPTENILGFRDGETEQKDYFRSYRLVSQKPVLLPRLYLKERPISEPLVLLVHILTVNLENNLTKEVSSDLFG